jgi:neutral trehalase
VFRTEAEKQNLYTQLKTAAESGWDFSTRWFIINSTNEGKLLCINAQNTSLISRRNVSIACDRQVDFSVLKYKDLFKFSDTGKY